jgi:hypothetical protein
MLVWRTSLRHSGDADAIPGTDICAAVIEGWRHLSFPICSWLDLRHACKFFHIWVCRNYFCLPFTSSISAFQTFLFPSTFPSRRCLFTMSANLRLPCLEFCSPRSIPDWESRRSPPPTCPVHPVLTKMRFKGVSEYLDNHGPHRCPATLPLVYNVHHIRYTTTCLIHLCTPTLKALEKMVGMVPLGPARHRRLLTTESSKWKSYGVEAAYSQLDGQDNIENVPWLELLPL